MEQCITRIQKRNSNSNALRKLGMIVVFPFAFLWFFLIYWKPGLKKLWNPEPIKVYVVGRNLESQHDATVTVIPMVRYKKQGVFKGNDGSYMLTAMGLMQNPTMEYAIRVDRPELLKNPSLSTIRSIKKKFEPLGYEIRCINVPIDGHLVSFDV